MILVTDAPQAPGGAHLRFPQRRGRGYHIDTQTWLLRIASGSSLVESGMVAHVDRLAWAINTSSFAPKILSLWPMVGQGLVAWRTPIIDRNNKGLMNAVGTFTISDYSSSGGLKGDGSSKAFDTGYTAGGLGASNNAGLGWWETDHDATGSTYTMMGSNANGGTNYYAIRNFSSTNSDFLWGLTANGAASSTTGTNGHFYGQRASATDRKFYANGAQVGSNTTNDATSGSTDRNMYLFGWNIQGTVQYYKGRCGLAYVTDGSLSAPEVEQLHYILLNSFMKPTGRAS